jgi:hypothetical protein
MFDECGVYREDGVTVANVGKCSDADISLIAAAPDILAALQAVFRQTVTLGLLPDPNCRELMAHALVRATIAKATDG